MDVECLVPLILDLPVPVPDVTQLSGFVGKLDEQKRVHRHDDDGRHQHRCELGDRSRDDGHWATRSIYLGLSFDLRAEPSTLPVADRPYGQEVTH